MLAFKPVLASFSASVFLYTVWLCLGLYLVFCFFWFGCFTLQQKFMKGFFTFYFVFRNRVLKLKPYALTLTKHKPLHHKGLSLK